MMKRILFFSILTSLALMTGCDHHSNADMSVSTSSTVNSREAQTDYSDWELLVPLGLIDSTYQFYKYGLNPDVDEGTGEDIWYAGGTYPVRTAAAPMLAASTDIHDDLDSTGCEKIIISGVSATYRKLLDTLTLNGTSNVETADTFFYVNSSWCYQAGSSRVNEGDITLTHKTDANTAAAIPTGQGQEEQAVYVVASDEIVLIGGGYVTLNALAATPTGEPSATIGLRYLDLSRSNSSWRRIGNTSCAYYGNSFTPWRFEPLQRIDGPAIIKVVVEESLDDDLVIAAELEGYTVKKNAVNQNLARIGDQQLLYGQ